jgi:hypothetical protein
LPPLPSTRSSPSSPPTRLLSSVDTKQNLASICPNATSSWMTSVGIPMNQSHLWFTFFPGVRVTTPTSITCSLPSSIPLISTVPLPDPRTVRDVHFGGKTSQPTPLYLLVDLQAGTLLNGPALVIDELTTLVVEPDCRAYVCEGGHVTVAIDALSSSSSSSLSLERVDPVLLSIFSHRFMSIAEQMGRTLQRTAISTNIKERLDFSCALFDAQGGLVANAPHIPVHLGSMQDAVRFQVMKWGSSLSPGKSICISFN